MIKFTYTHAGRLRQVGFKHHKSGSREGTPEAAGRKRSHSFRGEEGHQQTFENRRSERVSPPDDL